MGFRIGDTVGDYKIVGVVGAGGAGQVFRVEHPITGRIEAMKVLLEGRGSKTEAPAARFLREIKLQASLDHPNIAAVYNAFWSGDELVMIMELVNGESLDRVVAQRRMPMGKVLRYSIQSLIALEYAHSRGITHRDIKPENIMVTPEGIVKLMDFGLAKDRNNPRMTELGAVVGSLFYISPEQARGLASVDHRADIYSFGSVLYEMTTGERPFTHKTSFDLLQAAVNEDPEPPSAFAPDMPPALESVILRAMSKDPADRFQSARELRRTIEAIVRNPGLEVPNVGVAAAAGASRTARRRIGMRKDARRQVLTRAALLIASVVVLAYLGMRAVSNAPNAEAALPVVEAPAQPEAPPPETGGSRNGFVLRQTIRLNRTPTALAFTRDGATLAAGLDDGRVRTWNTNTGALLADLTGPQGKIAAVTLAASAGRVAAVDANGEAYLWDASGKAAPQALPDGRTGRLLRFSEDGKRLAVAADDGSVHVWDLDSKKSWSFPGSERVPRALAFSPTGPLMAVSGKGEIALWGVGLSDKRETLSARGDEAEAIAFSANGLEMAAGVGSQVIVWDLPTRRRSRTLSLSGTVRALAYSDARGWIAVTSDKSKEQLSAWLADKGQRITSIRLSEPASSIALSRAGDRLAAATEKAEVHYWDTLPTRAR